MKLQILVWAGPSQDNAIVGFGLEDFVYPDDGEIDFDRETMEAVNALLEGLDRAKDSIEKQARAVQATFGQPEQPPGEQ